MSRLVKRFSSTITLKAAPPKAHFHRPLPASSFPTGFLVTGIHAGVKKKPDVLDVALIVSTSDHPASAAACFTRNAFKAAPVVVSEHILTQNRGRARAVVVNSGCANAVTGRQGMDDAWAMVRETDALLPPSTSLAENHTLVMSTGVIGQTLPISKIVAGIRSQATPARSLASDFSAWERAAQAFMTTDTFPKLRSRVFTINGTEYRMAGMDKGAGMIHPNMGPSNALHATLLGCIRTVGTSWAAAGTLTSQWAGYPADPISFLGHNDRLRQRQLGGMAVWYPPIEQTPIGRSPFRPIGGFQRRHAPRRIGARPCGSVRSKLDLFGTGGCTRLISSSLLPLLTHMERAYSEDDLASLSQKELVVRVQRQIQKWPHTPGSVSKTRKDILKSHLLDPKNGFTTDQPRRSEPPRVEPERLQHEVFNNSPPLPSQPDAPVNTIREVRLFIEDRRLIHHPAHTSQRVHVNFIDSAGCSDGEWRANALEVLIALQKSFSKLTGSGKIGVPDRLHPTYTEYFVELIAEQPIEMLTVSPDILVISPDGHLSLRVDCISNLPPATAFGDSGLSPASTSPGAVAGSSNSSTGVEARLQDPLREIEWLKSKLSTRLGYAKFTTSHHKILQNVERVRYWRFAADFTSDFHKKAWPHDVSSSKTISKAAIEKALQMSRSALVDANQMIELIDRFTAEGSNYSQQVADTVDKSDDEAPSAANLKAFLKEWDSEHGGQSWEE